MAKSKQRIEQAPQPVTLNRGVPASSSNGQASTRSQDRKDPAKLPSGTDDRPRWRARKRILTWEGVTVKILSDHATIQCPVLNALQKARWQRIIPNPFTGPRAKQRLHDAIAGLKIDQLHPSIELVFGQTGKGTHLWWDWEKREESVPQGGRAGRPAMNGRATREQKAP